MENKFTAGLIEKAKQAKSAVELLAIAKKNGFELTEDEAKNYFERLNNSGELSDDELNNVSGGCGGCRECAFCGYPISKDDGWVCRSCGKQN